MSVLTYQNMKTYHAVRGESDLRKVFFNEFEKNIIRLQAHFLNKNLTRSGYPENGIAPAITPIKLLKGLNQFVSF